MMAVRFVQKQRSSAQIESNKNGIIYDFGHNFNCILEKPAIQLVSTMTDHHHHHHQKRVDFFSFQSRSHLNHYLLS